MGGPWESNSPFGGHFGPQFGEMGRPPFDGPFRGDFSDHYNHKPSFGPFGKPKFDHSPERYCNREPDLPRWGPFEHSHRGYSRHGPSECHCCLFSSREHRHERSCDSAGTDRANPWFERNAAQQCCERRGPSNCFECSCRRRCEETRGCDHYWSECCQCASTRPCCDRRRQCHDNSCEGRSRYGHCEKSCKSEPCCSENTEDQESENSSETNESEPEDERNDKIRLVILWLLRELFWKTFNVRHLSDPNMDIIITSTADLQRSLELDID